MSAELMALTSDKSLTSLCCIELAVGHNPRQGITLGHCKLAHKTENQSAAHP